ncbi:hypothetical protein QAD02_007440 [Eretmocerus hayati]|uniref:Uncharacterized protein n=1 Tax=Eretmocerus hayati TaxID=131215 RepID=A0ACC2N4X1_9HYME|nr:hypothetical protein QAD02_007440 [Eretmocerus hayati]
MEYALIFNVLLTFFLKLSADPNLPRNLVDSVVSFIDDFLKKTFLPSLKSDIFEILARENISAGARKDMEKCFEKHSVICDEMNTESKRFTHFKKVGLPKLTEFIIGSYFKQKIVGNEIVLAPESLYGRCIPLKNSLKMFLGIPGIFDSIMTHITRLNSETHIISSILQGSLWKSKYAPLCINEIVLPLYVFCDELECGNPLGAHAGVNKFVAMYAMLACLPPHLSALMNCILFYGLFRSSDKKNTSNKGAYKTLIDELNFLSRVGINIDVNGVLKNVKFKLVLFVGDNLGLNSIFGFNESFISHYFCRICKCSKDEASKLCMEDENKLRKRQNYDDDVQRNNASETAAFNYGPSEALNKPPTIVPERVLKHDKLKMSASEALTFVRFFGLIMGEFIPEDDAHYKLYRYLRRILDILLSPRFIKADAIVLAEFIRKMNSLYIEFYGRLKPKMHFLIHYPAILSKNGPATCYWTMRFESFHQPIKNVATSTRSSKNLLKTVVTKMALQMLYFTHTLDFSKSIKFGSLHLFFNRKSYFENESKNKSYLCYNDVTIDGIDYKLGMFLFLGNLNEYCHAHFGEILQIISVDGEIFFSLRVYDEQFFDSHVHAYSVEKTKEERLVNVKCLPIFSPVLFVISNGQSFIATKHGI